MATPDIPKQHKACVYSKPGTNAVEIEMIDTPQPGPGEVLIKLYVPTSPDPQSHCFDLDPAVPTLESAILTMPS